MSSLVGTTVALSGAEGFIGRWVVAQLYESGATVLILKGDVQNPDTFNGSYQILLHLAGVAHLGFARNFDEARNVNIEGVRNALAGCSRNQARLVFASSSGVYDPAQHMPVNENGKIAPKTPYTDSKLAGELMCAAAAAKGNCQSTVLRLFNPYGPGQPKNMLISFILDSIFDGISPIIKSPDSGRDFLHVEDVAKAFIITAGGNVDYEVLNVGSGIEYTVRCVCNQIIKISGLDIIPEYCAVESPPTSVIANINEIYERYGWQPQIGLDKGLKNLIKMHGKRQPD